MKNLFLLCCFCFPSFLFAQSNIKIEFLSSLDYSDRQNTNSGIVQSVRSSELGKLNYHFDLSYHQKLKGKLWLKIGLQLASNGYKSGKTELRFGSQHNGQGGFDPNLPSGETVQNKTNYQFLGIPIALRFDFSQKKLKPFLELGLTTKYYLQSINNSFASGRKSGTRNKREEGVSQIQLAPTLSFGFSYELNEKFELVAQPNFTFHLSKNYRESADLSLSNGLVKEHLWNVGVALGIRMDLN